MGKKKEEETMVLPTPEEEEEEEYEVEKVVNKRVVKGKIQYFIKWKNFPDTDNTWEPDENLECPELIEQYEKKIAAEKTVKEKPSAPATKTEDSKKRKSVDKAAVGDGHKRAKINNDEKPKGFQRGLEPDKIVGATDSGGTLTFLMKWQGSDEADLVTSEEANIKCPHVVIQFYEDRLTWHTTAQETQ